MTTQEATTGSFIWPTAFAGLIGAALLSAAVLVGPVDAEPLFRPVVASAAVR